jgi:hypothetical protein
MTGMLRSKAEAFRQVATPKSAGYQPGVCNIGPDEIARRRRAGHIGAIITAGLLAILLVIGAPPIWRLLIAIPAAGTAITYLQAVLHFCVAFARLGVFNFGAVGELSSIADQAARRTDQNKARLMILAGCAVGLAVGTLAVWL